MSEKSIYLYYVEANLSEEDIINRLDVWKTKFLNEIILKYLDKYLKLLKISINEYKIKNEICMGHLSFQKQLYYF